ncbi:unnamed protein product [Adineta ricciae]|uniref:NIDO domain-containing protein n=1 Tax=Adineta ricciae TaxID=249248 RepID=A0A815A2P9_ADIRI|nr:unnamed protein product [Adineta ricciae]
MNITFNTVAKVTLTHLSNRIIIYNPDENTFEIKAQQLPDKLPAFCFPGSADMSQMVPTIVTWDRVPGYGSSFSFRNTFQAIITTNGINSSTIYNYKQLKWSYDSASSGIHAQTEVLSIVNDSNVVYPDRFIFTIGGDITNVACNITNGLQVASFRGSTYEGYEIRFCAICFNELNYIVKIGAQKKKLAEYSTLKKGFITEKFVY